jgi:putative component of membrane protein insertase Oxa1/YidC/SpoIIIJ protein YidD
MTLEYPPSDYPTEPRLRDLPRTVWNWPRLALLGLIRLYQMTMASSHYGYQAVYKFGVFKGGAKAIWRVLRCNPFNPGGYDPVL